MLHIRHLLLLFLILSPCCLKAQDLDYAKKVLDTLCSPDFHGRGYVLRGDSLAAEFIKNQYADIGISPTEAGYFQPFSYSINTLNGELSLHYNDQVLKPGAAYLADPSSSKGKGKGEIVPLTLHEIIQDNWVEKVRSRDILTVDLSGMDTLQKAGKDKVLEFVEYLKFEKDIKSKAIVFQTKGKIPWSVSAQQAYRPIFTIFEDSVNSQKENEIAFKIDAEWKENYQSKNVIGFIPGTSSSDSILVLTAHYDHLGRMGLETYFPGANDNASGVALMMDLAGKIKNEPLKYDTYFIAFAGEEAGLKGSFHFVENPVFPLNKVKFLVNLDLAGTGDEGIMAINGKTFEEKFQKLKDLNNSCECMPEVKARGEACNSDHCPFHLKGVPGFFIYTLGGTSYYHDIYDTPETLDLNYYESYFKLLYSFLKAQ